MLSHNSCLESILLTNISFMVLYYIILVQLQRGAVPKFSITL